MNNEWFMMERTPAHGGESHWAVTRWGRGVKGQRSLTCPCWPGCPCTSWCTGCTSRSGRWRSRSWSSGRRWSAAASPARLSAADGTAAGSWCPATHTHMFRSEHTHTHMFRSEHTHTFRSEHTHTHTHTFRSEHTHTRLGQNTHTHV